MLTYAVEMGGVGSAQLLQARLCEDGVGDAVVLRAGLTLDVAVAGQPLDQARDFAKGEGDGCGEGEDGESGLGAKASVG